MRNVSGAYMDCESPDQSQGFRCLLTESFDIIEYINGEQMPG